MSFIGAKRRVWQASVIAAAAGCAHGATPSAGDGELTFGGGGSGGGASAAGCSASVPCAPGSACHNGACAEGCNSDADCDASEYCAKGSSQFCQPRELSICPDVPCAATQACVQGLCATQTGTACGPSAFNPGADGCPEDELCMGQLEVNGVLVETKQCYTLPACGPDNSCPVGTDGAVCSFGLIGNKDTFCIPNTCVGAENCPSSMSCVRLSTSDLVGRCSDGLPGSLCSSGADCGSQSCVLQVTEQLGACQ